MGVLALFIATVVYIILGIGAVLFIIGLILDIRWVIKAKKGNKVGAGHKAAAVILSVLGVLLFVIPGIYISFGIGQQQLQEYRHLADIGEIYESTTEVPVLVNYKGTTYSRMDYLSGSVDIPEDRIADLAVKVPSGGYYEFYEVQTESGNTVLYSRSSDCALVASEDILEVRSHYMLNAPLNVSLNVFEADGDVTEKDCSLSTEILRDLIALSIKDMEQEIDREDITDRYVMTIRSDDGLYVRYVTVAEINGTPMVLREPDYQSADQTIYGIEIPSDTAAVVMSGL